MHQLTEKEIVQKVMAQGHTDLVRAAVRHILARLPDEAPFSPTEAEMRAVLRRMVGSSALGPYHASKV